MFHQRSGNERENLKRRVAPTIPSKIVISFLNVTIYTTTSQREQVSVLILANCLLTEDKIFTCIILSNADIRVISSESRSPPDPSTLPPYLKDKKSYYVLEIENESRKYVLSAKSHFDLMEWFNAIYAQIESLNTNRLLAKTSSNTIKKEQEIAHRDQL